MGQENPEDQEKPELVRGLKPGESAERDRRVGRRAFLGGAAALSTAAGVDALARVLFPGSGSKPVLVGGGVLQLLNPPIKPSFSIDVRRREDFLFLRADGYNVIRSGQSLKPTRAGADARLVITFAPQHLAEQTFSEQATPPARGRIDARLAYPSRLAFIIPASGIPLTIEGLLDWTNLTPALTPVADYFTHKFAGVGGVLLEEHSAEQHKKRHGRHRRAASARKHKARQASSALPKPQEPKPDETAIELPWRLALSPIRGGAWSHESEAITLNGATEMWRTQLVSGIGDSEKLPGGPIRAVWNYDTVPNTTDTPTLNGEAPPSADQPINGPLDPVDRWSIVKASSDFSIAGRADISASQLLLSARGGSLTAEASWNPRGLDIQSWSHEATQGRDHFVQVVYKGFLFPFGHHVSYVKVTQREFNELRSETVGVLREHTYLVVGNPIVSYAGSLNVANNGRDFPFRALELKDTRTPDLDTPVVPFATLDVRLFGNLGPRVNRFSPGPGPFVPTVGGGSPFMWHFVGTDWSGRTTSFLAQAVFVAYENGIDSYLMDFLAGVYNRKDPTNPVRTTDFGGKTLTFAESATAGDTDFPTYGMTFAASPGAALTQTQYEDNNLPAFVPTLVSEFQDQPSGPGQPTGAQVSVGLPAVEQASGAPLDGNSRPLLAYYPDFVQDGFYDAKTAVNNKVNVFMKILGDATKVPTLKFGGKNGSVISPNMQLAGLSRSFGPVSDLENLYKYAKFDPKAIFGGIDGATILGGVKLSDLLDVVGPITNPDALNPGALHITTSTKGEVVTTTVTWTPPIAKNLPANAVITPIPPPPAPPDPTKPLGFNLTCVITTDLNNRAKSSYTISGTLTNFIVHLVGLNDPFIAVTFNKFSFKSVNGAKPKFDVGIDKVDFTGALKFVDQLKSYMDFSGAGGPSITDLVDAISTDLSIKLPAIDVGIISLSNVAIDTGFKLPFDGSAAGFNFGFSTRDNPFALAIGIFGGGGFFNLEIGTDGVHVIEASLYFGAMAAFDIGVASGSVSVVAGFYFYYGIDTAGHNSCVLSGFVKISGNLSVLGIINLSLEFDLTLTYVDPGTITGTATLVVSISLLCFSKTVTLTTSKTFSNGSGSGSGSSARRGLAVHRDAQVTLAPQSFSDQMDQPAWDTYCRAFRPVS
jgi:hypothetical protein